MAALDAPIAVGWDEGEPDDAGSLDHVGDYVCRLCGDEAQAAFLPGRDQRAHRSVIGDGCARGGEREPTARALEAALDRPGGGRPTARTTGAAQPRETRAAGTAERWPKPGADSTAARSQKVEEHIRLTVRGKSARVGDESAPKS